MVVRARHVELQSNYISRCTVGEIFLLNQSSRYQKPPGWKVQHEYSITRERETKEKSHSGNFLPRFNVATIQRKEKHLLMDSQLYIFHAWHQCIPLSLPPSLFLFVSLLPLLVSLCNQLEIQLPTIFPREEKEERTWGGGALVLQFKVANSPANLLLLL